MSDLAPGNLPAGASPDNQNCFFIAQEVATRPAMINALSGSGSINTMSHAPYVPPTGRKYIMALDSEGNINQYDVAGESISIIGTVPAGHRFSSASAFGKFFMSFFDADESSNFSHSQFSGTDIPRYVNSLGHLNRVTSEGPGGGLEITGTDESLYAIASLSRSNGTVTAVITDETNLRVGWFVNIQDSQGTPGLTPDGTSPFTGNELFQAIGGAEDAGNPITSSINRDHHNGNSAVVLSATAGGTSPGTRVFVYYDSSHGTGDNPQPDSGLAAAFAAAQAGGYELMVTVANMPSATDGSGVVFSNGTFPIVAASGINSNETTAIPKVVGNSDSHHWLYFAYDQGGSAGFGGTLTVPTNTSATYSYTLRTSSTAIAGDGNGNINVTVSAPLTNLSVGSWLYLYLNSPIPSAITNWEINSSAGTGTIWVPGVTWATGQSILLNGFQNVSKPNTQPTSWNGQTVLLTSADNTAGEYTFLWPGGTDSGGEQVSVGGTAQPTGSIYPSGWIQVTQIINTYQFVYFAVNNTLTTTTTGVVYDYFGSLNTQLSLTAPVSGQTVGASSAQNIAQGFQILSISEATNSSGVTTTITWYQPGIDDTYDGTHVLQAVPQTQIAPGPRSAFCFFISEDGGASPGSPPIQFALNGGSQYASVILPVGPPGTVARGLAVTPAYGADYFTQGAASLKGTTGEVIIQGLIINDNETLGTIFDWSDAALVAAIPVSTVNAVGSDFGDLTSTITLGPCLGVIAYDQMLAWFGEINNVKNLVNMSMQGGAISLSDSAPVGKPLGWDHSTEYNFIIPDGTGALVAASDGSGWAYRMGGASGRNSMISQVAYQDVWGGTILLPDLTYLIRFRAKTTGSLSGNINFVLYSANSGGVLASASAALSSLPTSWDWTTLTFNAATPDAASGGIPSDTVLYVTLSGLTTTGEVDIADLLLIPEAQPVLNNQVRLSYVDNEFGYDNENGFTLGLTTTDSIVSAFVMRQYLYLNTENDLYVTSNNGSQPAEWDVTYFAQECGGSGPNAIVSLNDLAWWVGRQGAMVFNGGPPKKISQEVQPEFDLTNWNYMVNSVVNHDAIQRVAYFSLPQGVETDPSIIYTMNHRMTDPAVNIMDPVHISSYTGKLIATDLARKWSSIILPINSIAPCWIELNGAIQRVLTFGGGGGY